MRAIRTRGRRCVCRCLGRTEAGEKVGQDMEIGEVLDRLKEWKLETENKDKLYINFDDILIAMRGNNRCVCDAVVQCC